MAGGWAKDGAIQDQIDATVADAVKRVRENMPVGISLENCEECDAQIPLARRQAVKGVKLCVQCQAMMEKQQVASASINRRGSKDSQLR